MGEENFLGEPFVLKNKDFWLDKRANTANWQCYESLVVRLPSDPWWVTISDESGERREHIRNGWENWPFSTSVKFSERYFGSDCSKWKNRVKQGL